MSEHKYNTRQRDVILDCLKGHKNDHMTADEIYSQLHENGKNVGRTTVYRYLDTLCDSGELLKYTVGEKSPCCYQLATELCHRHYHMVCVKCGALIHTECSEINDFIAHFEKEHKFIVDMTKTTLYGVCERCQKKEVLN